VSVNSPADYLEAARKLQRRPDHQPPIRVAFLATYTAAPRSPYPIAESARRGLHIMPWFGPYNQIDRQCLASNSELYAFQTGGGIEPPEFVKLR
jgi:hypothetical protein